LSVTRTGSYSILYASVK